MNTRTLSLPLETRLADRCSTLLVLTDELLTEFTTADTDELLWVEERLRRIYGDVDRLVQRFAQ